MDLWMIGPLYHWKDAARAEAIGNTMSLVGGRVESEGNSNIVFNERNAESQDNMLHHVIFGVSLQPACGEIQRGNNLEILDQMLGTGKLIT